MSRAAFAAFLMLGAASCGREPKPFAAATLFEKGSYQAIYGPDGKITRLLYDGNADKRADTVTLYHPNGTPRQIEIDTDYDGVVDRIEHLEGQRPARVEVDSDRDGRMDRWQIRSEDRLVQEELDTDGDGVADRCLRYGRGADLIELDVLGPPRTPRGGRPAH